MRFLLSLLPLLIYYGCFEDPPASVFTGELSLSARILVYFENNGDFINTNNSPAILDADEVSGDLNNYSIVDIRSYDEFISGHIQFAINVSADSLYGFISNHFDTSASQIVLVGTDGQKSVYFSSLFQLAGFSNVFALKYGMASWHLDFASGWLDILGDDTIIDEYSNDIFPKNSLSRFPDLNISETNDPINLIIQNRIKKITGEGYRSGLNFLNNFPEHNDNYYLICYGKDRLYYAPFRFIFGGKGHPNGVINYLDSPLFDFQSANYLQTLPIDKSILIYSYSGHLSASMVAYLRVLGYDAISLSFGTHQLFYSRMIDDPELRPFTFTTADIMNFDYVTGEE